MFDCEPLPTTVTIRMVKSLISAALIAACAALGCSNPVAESGSAPLTFVSLEAGGLTTCGLTADRELYCWGQPLGNVMAVDSQAECTITTYSSKYFSCNPRPTLMTTGLQLDEITMSKGSSSHLCGLTTVGEVYCWGRMRVTYDFVVSVGKTPTLRPLPQPAKAVAAGETHDCAAVISGEMYCWGDYDWNPRGTGGPVQHDWDLVPNLVVGGWSFREVATGSANSCGMELNGEALCWGWPLGVGVSDPPVRTDGCGLPLTCVDHPIRVAGQRQFRQLESGGLMSCGIDHLRRLYCCGRSVGDGTAVDRPEPVLVDIPGGAITVSIGAVSNCAISSYDVTHCWGANFKGRLGVASSDDPILSPAPVQSSVRLQSVSVGTYHTCGLDDGGRAWCWGWNRYGQLGTGDTLTSVVPKAVVGPRS